MKYRKKLFSDFVEVMAEISARKPIYGLIFLFQYQADNPEKMEECPDDVWFAQQVRIHHFPNHSSILTYLQVAMNSCASVSLLNIIMNVPNVDIGESLAGLKRSTSSDLTPRKRGEVVRDCKFVRVIHNSFALKSDLLNEVIDFNQPVTPKKKPSDSSMRSPRKFKKSKTGRAKKRKTVDEDSAADGAFHFIAFVPINGKVWKLDGMDAQPMNLGPFENNWLDLACDEISSRMKASELVNKTGFSLQAVCCSPLKMLSTLLAENLARLLCVEQILSIKDTDWSAYIDPDSAVASTVNLLGPDGEACVCPELLAEAKSKLDNDENSCPEITKPENTTTDLVNIREKAIGAQTKLCSEYMEELRVVKKDEEQANKRRQEPQDTTGESAQDDTEMLTPRTQEMIAKIDYATSMHDLMQGLVFTKNGRAESPVPVDLHSKVHVGEF